MRIKKVSQSAGVVGNVVNSQSNSTTDTYSCNYANGKNGVVLYTGNSVSTITLSDNVSNYSAVEIEYARGNFVKSTGKITNYSAINLDGFWVYFDEGVQSIVFQTYGEIINVSGTSITRNDTYYMNLIGTSVSGGNFSGGINILKVIGYK